jgi:two-component system cell cycle sensor histidine kinase/response regulator CckA
MDERPIGTQDSDSIGSVSEYESSVQNDPHQGRSSKIYSASRELVMIITENGRVRYANRRCRRMFNDHAFDPMKSSAFQILSSEEDRGRLLGAMAKSKTSVKDAQPKAVDAGEYCLLDASQRPHWFHLRVTNLLNDHQIAGFVLNGIDMTPAVLAQKKLEEQMAFYTRILDALPNLVFVKDREGAFILVNKTFADFRGVRPSDLMGKTERQLYGDPELVRRFLREDMDVMDSGKEKILPELQSRAANGELRRIVTIKRPLKDSNGSCNHVVGFGVDVTLLRAAEEENARLASIPHESPQPILTADSAGEIVYANPAARCIAEEINLASLDELLPVDHEEIVLKCIEKGENVSSIETSVGGRHFQWLYHPLRGHDVVHIHGTEVTESKRAEQQLRETERRLQTAQRLESVGQLASGIAHDFNNVLTVIMGFGSLARLQVREDLHLLPHLEQVKNSAEKAAAMTRRLLMFGKRQPSEFRVMNPNAAVIEIEKMLQRFAGGSINFYLCLERSAWNIMGDPALIDQMLLNLVVNARDAMPNGGSISLETRNVPAGDPLLEGVDSAQSGDFLMISVCDTGTGMDPDTASRVFELYFTTKGEGKGTGLGLSTVYSIVKEHQGMIGLETKPGEGTCFRIFIPRSHESVEEVPILARPTDTNLGLHAETVLVVEPDPAVRNATTENLRAFGYRVLEALNGSDALAMADGFRKPIAVLITDLVLPKMKGKDLAREVTTIHPETRVVYTSGQEIDSLDEDGSAAPRGSFLQKPYAPDDLLRMVGELSITRS